MDKILSIIIPTYNMESYLQNTLSSLLIDKHQDLLDIIIVNDGSNDSSLSIARSYEAKYSDTFRVIDKKNGNYGSCINCGLFEAKGKYIKILDADDSFETKAFCLLIEKLNKLDVDMVVTDYIIVDESGTEKKRHIRKDIQSEVVIDVDLFLNCCMNDLIMMHEITYRTDVLRQIKYHQTEGIAFTDSEWSLIPLKKVRTMYYTQLPIYKYLVGRQGQTVDARRAVELQPQGNKTLFAQIEAFSNMSNLSPIVRKYMIAHITRNLRFTYRTYMISAYKFLNNSELIEIDNDLLRINKELYTLLGNIRVQPGIPLYFVRAWRNAGYNVPNSVKIFRKMIYPLIKNF